MGSIYFSRKAFKALNRMERAESKQIVGSLERIRIRPEKYVRRVISDPCYRLRISSVYLYIDLIGDDIVVLFLNQRSMGTEGSK